MEGLEELQEIVEQLTKTVESDTGIDLSTLELPLRRCIHACKEFKQKILKCLSGLMDIGPASRLG